MRQTRLKPQFVEFVPDQLDDGVLYISERFRTCSHKCCCGCGDEVVLPLSPAEWQLSRDGDFVSLWPSVGNWDYPCRSHYVIRRNQVRWAASMTAHQIRRVKQRDEVALRLQINANNAARATGAVGTSAPSASTDPSGAPLGISTSNGPSLSIWKWVRGLLGFESA